MPTLPEPVPRQFIPTASTWGLARWPAEPNLKGARWIGETGRRTVRVNVRETSGHSLVARIYLGCFWDGPVDLPAVALLLSDEPIAALLAELPTVAPFMLESPVGVVTVGLV